MALRVRTLKRRTAEKLSVLLDRVERLAGRRFYELHLEAAALRHRQGANVVELRAGSRLIKFRTPSAKALWRAENSARQGARHDPLDRYASLPARSCGTSAPISASTASMPPW